MDVRRRIGLVALVVTAVLAVAACRGGDGGSDPSPVKKAAEPGRAPFVTTTPTGRIVDVGALPQGIVYDPKTRLLAVAVRDPFRLLLLDPTTLAVEKSVPLPGKVRHLQLARPGGPVLVPVESANQIIEVSLPGGETQTTDVERQPHDAAGAANGDVVVGKIQDKHKQIQLGNKAAKRRSPKGSLAARIRRTVGGSKKVSPRKVADARPSGTARIQRMKDRVKQASDTRALGHLLEEFNAKVVDDPNLSDQEVNDLAQQLDDRAKQLAQYGWFGKGLDSTKFDQADMASVQQAHFDDGGTIANAPSEGLFAHIQDDPRFDKVVEYDYGKKGAGEITYITDTVTGEKWVAKLDAADNGVAKEVLAGKVFNAIGLNKHEVKFSQNIDEEPTLIVRDAVQGNGLKGELDRVGDHRYDQAFIVKTEDEEINKGLEARDPQGLIDLAMYDYLIDNQVDRHLMNAFFDNDRGKLKMLFIDQGLAFGGHYSEDEPSEYIKPLKNFTEFAHGYRGWGQGPNYGGWNGAELIGQITHGHDERMARVADAAKRFEALKAKLPAIRKQYEEDFKNDAHALDNVDSYMKVLEARLAHLTDKKNHGGIVAAMEKFGA